MINGLHHISMKCGKGEQYAQVVRFYHEILGLKIARVWGDENAPDGIMFDTGSGLIEIFTNKTGESDTGIIRHFALETTDVDESAVAVKSAGYEVFVEPKDITIPSDPPYNARMAFCFGPLGDQIEFFQVKREALYQ